MALEAARTQYVAGSIATGPAFAAGAHGATVTDTDGREYIDFVGGIGCLNGGHTPEAVVKAVRRQAGAYMHQGFAAMSYEPYVDVCRRLVACHPGHGPFKAMLANSGAEAVENAVRIARMATGRPGIICFERAFHGRTLLAASLTAIVSPYKLGFSSGAPDVYRAMAPYEYRGISAEASLASVRRLMRTEIEPTKIAACIYEPVQGEGGMIPAPPDFLLSLQELLHSYGILLILDEVQSGMCRTGLPAASMHFDRVRPDLIAWGKSLGGGLPLAGVTGKAALMDGVPRGSIGGTFGGNPVSCAAGRVVLESVCDPAFQAQAQELGTRLREQLLQLQIRHDTIGDVRGLGPMLGIELVTNRQTKLPATELAAHVVAEARRRGLLLKTAGVDGNVLRVLVPLVASPRELEDGLARLDDALAVSCRQLASQVPGRGVGVRCSSRR